MWAVALIGCTFLNWFPLSPPPLLNPSGGFVGPGTTNPSTPLHIVSSTNEQDAPRFEFGDVSLSYGLYVEDPDSHRRIDKAFFDLVVKETQRIRDAKEIEVEALVRQVIWDAATKGNCHTSALTEVYPHQKRLIRKLLDAGFTVSNERQVYWKV